MHIYTYTCRIHIDALIKTSEDFFKKYIYLTLFERFVCERELDTEQNSNILTSTRMAISVVSFSFSRASQPEARGPSSLLNAGFLHRTLSPMGLVSKLTDFLSSPSYIIFQSPTQYLPITGHRGVSLPLSLEWHVWLSSNRNNCHAVHRSLSCGASVWLYCGILPCRILSAKPAYANGICNFRVFGMACLAGLKPNIQQNVDMPLKTKTPNLHLKRLQSGGILYLKKPEYLQIPLKVWKAIFRYSVSEC